VPTERAELRRLFLLAASVLACSFQLLQPCAAGAADSSSVYARVLVDTTPIYAGPDYTYRTIVSAHRNALYAVRSRAAAAYFFEVELPDGTTGFIRGDSVHVSTISDEEANAGRFLPALFAPPPLMEAHAEVALVGGVLGGGGMIALRPSWLLSPNFGIEATAAAAVAQGGRLLIAMLGPFVNMFPEAPVVPFFNVAGGVIASSPNADTFLLQSSSLVGLSAGAGLRIGFRYRITLRLEARSYLFFETDRYVREEELSAGLSVFL
jgi:hypothetical protein